MAGAAPERPLSHWRDLLSVTAAVLLVGAVVPPLASSARRLEVVQALQFSLLAVAVPALVTLGAPWRRLGLAGAEGQADLEGVALPERLRPADRLAAAHHRHRQPARAFVWLVLFAVAAALWRAPVGVDALVRHPWFTVLEAVTLVGTGIALWLELVASPPFAPRLSHPLRIAVAALAMWTIWVTAYLVGLSHTSVYVPYHHVAGRDLSVWADQALTTALLWLASLAAFLPVIFSNLMTWLRGDDDADDALYRLVRDGRPVGWMR
jgi:cytochrome c oxidase assembly factor CtaG